MYDGAYIEHTFSIYSAYIGTRWKPGGGKGISTELRLHAAWATSAFAEVRAGRDVWLCRNQIPAQQTKARTDEDNRSHVEGEQRRGNPPIPEPTKAKQG